jgi:hypothetical protein
VLLATGFNDPKKFPSFERFYPEVDSSGRQKVDRLTSRAMKIAEKLGDI